MPQDIALPAPAAANPASSPASGGPPGAGLKAPAGFAPALAAVLARPAPPPPGRPPAARPGPSDNSAKDNPSAKDDTSGDESADDNTASSSSLLAPIPILISVQALPPDMAAQAAALVLSSPPVPVTNQFSSQNLFSQTHEAMDTTPASLPALSGSAPLPSGGELLLQPAQAPSAQAPSAQTPLAQTVGPAGTPVPAPFTLPGGTLPPDPAAGGAADAPPHAPTALDNAAPGSGGAAVSATPTDGPLPAQTPLPAAPALAAQGYAQFSQMPLQNAAQPANNTGKAGLTSKAGQMPAPPGAADKAAPVLSQAPPLVPATPKGAAETETHTAGNDAAPKDHAPKDKLDTDMVLMHSEMVASAPAAGASVQKSAPAQMPAEARATLTEQASGGLQTLHAQAVKTGHGQMTLQLHPQDWGKLQVSVTMTPGASAGGGTLVAAHLVADNAAVKQALEDHTSDLRRTLRDAGLHLESLTVTVRPASESSAASGQPQDTRREGQTPPNLGASPGNAGTAFGGGSAHGRTQSPPAPAFAAFAPAEETTAPAAAALPAPAAGRVDTRA